MTPHQIPNTLDDYLESDTRFRAYMEDPENWKILCDNTDCKKHGTKIACYYIEYERCCLYPGGKEELFYADFPGN